MTTNLRSQIRLSFGSQYKFPLKLMEVANDGILVRWTDDNKSVIVHEKTFEAHVMEMYPGFVQVGSFHNLRRLFRDYNFRFRIVEKFGIGDHLVEFRHPNFSKNDFHQVFHVSKRYRIRNLKLQRQLKPLKKASLKPDKKAKRIKFQTQPPTLKTIDCKSRKRSKRCKNDTNSKNSRLVKSKPSAKLNVQNSFIVEDYRNHITPKLHLLRPTSDKSYELFSGAELLSRHTMNKSHSQQRAKQTFRPRRQDTVRNKLLHLYAKNELTESQFWELITRNVNTSCSSMSWEMMKEHIDSLVYEELSPIHFKGFYYELSLSEM